ncbi:outer membrane protein assembly factor BamB family protein [Billgrantia diversa]|uniref:outer membrane protein assembly factor BamB family protein n=1 Tax=Halomonas sp. MCCC 1A13316 TaxID=2733487 RepID=UPI001E2FD2F0|nr:PQQ-binding-like beta-propeller repeat protein [Halomonas sp. MCCC 1A13316]
MQPPSGDDPPEPPRQGPDAWMESAESWATLNGDLRAQKYSPADQITPENVGELEQAWEYHTGDVADGSDEVPMSVWSATPLFVNDTLYLGTPFYRIIALEPGSGEEKWTFDPEAPLEALTQANMKGRGVAYWEADEPLVGVACQKRVYIGTMDDKLHGVDADTGKRCADFGDNGMVDVNQWNTVNDKRPLSLFQPPTVYNDTLFLGWAGKDWTDAVAPPGTDFALDARTGERKWTFHALPEEVVDRTGTANVWASMSLDPETGLLYIPISSPSPNYYGGERTEELPQATLVTALNTETGEVVWSRQLVHHDIWDYDTVAPPTLVDIEKDGETVPTLVQPSKQGFLFVLNRETGEPVYPIEEREVPASDAEGEQASPTQPFVDVPEPVVPRDDYQQLEQSGERLWNEPFGQVQKHGFYMPESWGSVTIGAPVITRSGLIFIGASMDSRVRAIDLESGEVLWKHLVDAPAVSMPAVYTFQGKQYVTFAVGGNSILLPKVSDQVVSFALPE